MISAVLIAGGIALAIAGARSERTGKVKAPGGTQGSA